MKREGVIITPIVIERQKQIKLFQIKIPREAKNIIGIEMGLRWQEGAPVPPAPPAGEILPMLQRRNRTVGELKLQSYGKANIFFTGELALNYNTDFADFTSRWFVPKEYTHQTQTHEYEAKVSGETTLIQGVYRDKLSEHQEGNYKYTVYVYVWMEAKEDLNNL